MDETMLRSCESQLPDGYFQKYLFRAQCSTLGLARTNCIKPSVQHLSEVLTNLSFLKRGNDCCSNSTACLFIFILLCYKASNASKPVLHCNSGFSFQLKLFHMEGECFYQAQQYYVQQQYSKDKHSVVLTAFYSCLLFCEEKKILVVLGTVVNTFSRNVFHMEFQSSTSNTCSRLLISAIRKFVNYLKKFEIILMLILHQ